MRRLAPVLLSAVLAGGEERPPLVVLEWSLTPGQAGFVEAAFVTGRPVFREPFPDNRTDIGAVVVSDVQQREKKRSFKAGNRNRTEGASS